MPKRLLYTSLMLFAGIVLAMSMSGCGSDESSDTVFDDPHAGHDHGPGEHGQTAAHASTDTDGIDWCAEHSVPESECTKCNPDLIDGFKERFDWCAGHDLPESHCRLCNPGLSWPQEDKYREQIAAQSGNAQTVAATGELDWCAAHAVPESECTQCNSGLIERFKESGDWCVGHDLPESHCRLCNPGIAWPQEEILRDRMVEQSENDIAVSLYFRPNTPVCATNDALIQFASAETAQRAGLSVQQVRASQMEASIEAPAEVVFDETAANVVTSTVPALVSRWLVSPGDIVNKGDVIALAQSPQIAELEAKLLSTYAANEVQQKEVARHEELKSRQLISDSEYELVVAEGERMRAEYISARGLLKSAGLSERDIEEVITHKKVTNEFALRAPTDGVIIERTAQLGELMTAGESFAMLADPSAMWIEAQLTEEQLRHVELGEELVFSSDGRGLSAVGAKVIWVSRFLDQHSRTGTVRAEILDPTHRLSAGEFGRARIVESGGDEVVLVPKDAVQWEGCCNVVFVKETDDRYRPRKVDFRDGEGPFYQVTNGLERGEQVVVDGAFLLKTELKKTSIGAGCCGIEPVG